MPVAAEASTGDWFGSRGKPASIGGHVRAMDLEEAGIGGCCQHLEQLIAASEEGTAMPAAAEASTGDWFGSRGKPASIGGHVRAMDLEELQQGGHQADSLREGQ